MTDPNKWLKYFSILSGVIPLVGGLMIFFTWWAARAWFAINLYTLEDLGITWIIFSTLFASAGILTSLYLLFKKNNGDSSIFAMFCLIVIIINVPACHLVVDKQSNLSDNAYIKVTNETDNSDLHFSIITKLNQDSTVVLCDFGQIVDDESEIQSYAPWCGRLSSYDNCPETFMRVHSSSIDTAIILPEIMKGDCIRLSIDENYRISN